MFLLEVCRAQVVNVGLAGLLEMRVEPEIFHGNELEVLDSRTALGIQWSRVICLVIDEAFHHLTLVTIALLLLKANTYKNYKRTDLNPYLISNQN